ncbi:MAG: NAD(P)H-dependent oxidoreductase [Marinirhabdus sp.]
MAPNIITRLQWRYATKKFDTSKKLKAEKLSVLKQSFNLTATSYGLQPLKMLVISDRKIKEQLVPHTMDQPQVADAPYVLVLCTETKVNAGYIRNYFEKVKKTRNTPDEILKPFELFLVEHFSNKTDEEINQWTAKQAYLAMGNLLTVCALEKIDACPIEGFEPEKYDSLLKLKQKGLRAILVLAVGHRAEDDLFKDLEKVRRGVENVVIEM